MSPVKKEEASGENTSECGEAAQQVESLSIKTETDFLLFHQRQESGGISTYKDEL